jgi:predicted enzyme related to lactoylglutathione lyase
MTYRHGQFVWFENLTSDVQRAKGYYGELFGWKIEPMSIVPGMSYDLIKVGEVPIGGFMKPPMDLPPHWLSYLSVADVDATATKVKAAGGRGHMDPMDIPTVGRFQPIADKQGASLATFRAADGDPPVAEGPGAILWNELLTDDVPGSLAFYREVFGLTAEDFMPGADYKILKQGDKGIGGVMKSPMAGMPSMWLPYVVVTGADQTAARAKKLGGAVVKDPEDIPSVGRPAVLKDPLGAVIGIIEPAKK